MPPKKKDTSSDRNTPIDYINRDIVNVKEDIQVLSKIVRDGNGHPSLMQEVATINNDIEHLRAEMDGRFNETRDLVQLQHAELHDLINRCNTKNSERQKLHWHTQTAIWVALIGSVTDILIHFFAK
jgi:gamma-glutamyl:cysteine ligase YbdK (ATP-grasp superfamily)